MTSIIITIVLNLLLGNPMNTTTEQDKNKTTTETKDEGTIKAKGGSGTWTSIEK